jgi:hypothetical protein
MGAGRTEIELPEHVLPYFCLNHGSVLPRGTVFARVTYVQAPEGEDKIQERLRLLCQNVLPTWHVTHPEVFECFPMPPALADNATTIGAGGSRTSRMEES